MANASQHRKVHLVGSVPLADSEEVFRTTSQILGNDLTRIPDGETGVRRDWIAWQSDVLGRNQALELVPGAGKDWGLRIAYRLRANVEPSAIRFDSLGYADAATTSYTTFARLKDAGVVRPSTRFQVCLPTPLATVAAYTTLETCMAVEPAYEATLLREVQQICAVIPHDQLSIQWDTAIEFALLEGVMAFHLPDAFAGITRRLVRIGNQVPQDVELGYHLCYGDADHQHFVQPKDASLLVSVANATCRGIARAVNWMHLPVPRDRNDDEYYAPLAELSPGPETELYLGLVHQTDGSEGAQKRIKTAARFVTDFGIATECGFGRRPTETIVPLLYLHHDVARGPAPAPPRHSQ
jgi:hypothetical protein